MLLAFLALWTATAPPPAPAQAPPSDSVTRARVVAALQQVQDSLDRVRGATHNFRTDLSAASPVVLQHRARRMHASCGAAEGSLQRLDSVLVASYPGKAAVALRREVRALRATLAECRREYDTAARWGERADSVRAWAPHRLSRLDAAMQRYQRAASVPPKPDRRR